jgi:(p)ppGpp synthase/HD superfamily hydrolase
VAALPAPPQLLAMPLHAVTEVYGEAGLRERLTLELRRLPDADRSTVEDVLHWASELHRDQRRTREPYVNHLLRVTTRIICYYHVTDPEVLAAALLHDAVEDQPWAMLDQEPDGGPPPSAQALVALGERFGPRVARLVHAVTNPQYDPRRDSDVQYLEHLRVSLSAEPWARVIKLSDFTDNGVGVVHTVGAKVRRAAEKYSPLLPVLRELLARPDTPLEPPVKAHIASQLDLAESRFAAILAS